MENYLTSTETNNIGKLHNVNGDQGRYKKWSTSMLYQCLLFGVRVVLIYAKFILLGSMKSSTISG